MEKVSQSQILKYCLKQKIPFAIYKLPRAVDAVLIISETVQKIGVEELFMAGEDIYVMAPFSLLEQKVLCLKCDFVIEAEVDMSVFEQIKKIKSHKEEVQEPSFCTDYAAYKNQFQKMLTEIQNGRISKAILSRIKHLDGINAEGADDFFYELCQSYPKAYTYMAYTPQSGLWTGASPELLFKAVEGVGTVVALAGTKKKQGERIAWGDKERDEQQMVSDFVLGVLNKYGIRNAVVKGPDTVVAGKILHLKTQFGFGTEQITDRLGSFVSDLHPTPAVCGLPKQESMKVIAEVELHKRTFYAGFLGRIRPNQIRLYVNIRSMKFTNGGVDLYLGGGITSGSDVNNEWRETELKAQTLSSVIKKVKGMRKLVNKDADNAIE
ncbi:isochorismate synthase [Saccharicrinis carchari]|uniref:Isochorismate synthase n=1 Tax=Saccharicrinis carchari TaxID=1168039 RepID=A0A521CZ07_SACCC|nr:chorismate-binding protein [Saccharicrinis carchari]SMO64664.1 isochorismate synthase [Saccharicrinis carchari]